MADSVKAKAEAAPGIERAHTLPSEYYVDPATWRRECERIFWRTWQCVGWREQVANPGDYFTLGSLWRAAAHHARCRRQGARFL